MSVRSLHQMTASISRQEECLSLRISKPHCRLAELPQGPPDQAGFINPNRADAPIPWGHGVKPPSRDISSVTLASVVSPSP